MVKGLKGIKLLRLEQMAPLRSRSLSQYQEENLKNESRQVDMMDVYQSLNSVEKTQDFDVEENMSQEEKTKRLRGPYKKCT